VRIAPLPAALSNQFVGASLWHVTYPIHGAKQRIGQGYTCCSCALFSPLLVDMTDSPNPCLTIYLFCVGWCILA
jgi:hypothetical protein